MWWRPLTSRVSFDFLGLVLDHCKIKGIRFFGPASGKALLDNLFIRVTWWIYPLKQQTSILNAPHFTPAEIHKKQSTLDAAKEPSSKQVHSFLLKFIVNL